MAAADVLPYKMVQPAALAPMIVPERTALVVVDVQVDFVSPQGALAAAGIDMAPLEVALQRVEALLAQARTANVTPVLLRVVTRPESDSRALRLLNERKGEPPEAIAICRDDTPGADYYRVRPQAGDIEIQKTLYSGFVGTTLDAQLRRSGIDTLVFCGFTTECCVDCTVRDAFHRGYHCFIVADACDAYAPHLHKNTLESLALNCALVVETAAVLAAWR
jgi:nicotinamidase-related amidase